MVKDERNRNAYSEEYDILGLRDIASMSARYVAREEGIHVRGPDVPNGTYSDFSCVVWELFNEVMRLGVSIGKGEEVGHSGSLLRW